MKSLIRFHRFLVIHHKISASQSTRTFSAQTYGAVLQSAAKQRKDVAPCHLSAVTADQQCKIICGRIYWKKRAKQKLIKVCRVGVKSVIFLYRYAKVCFVRGKRKNRTMFARTLRKQNKTKRKTKNTLALDLKTNPSGNSMCEKDGRESDQTP